MEKFNLNWHTFLPHVNDTYKELFETKKFSDVTLISDDLHQFKAHKFILSSCSVLFQSLLGNYEVVSPFLYLRGVSHQELESILQFIYLGVATSHQERMNIFLDVAQDLQIKEIGEGKESVENVELPSSKAPFPVDKEEVQSNHNEGEYFEADTVISNTNQSEWSCGLCDKKLTTRKGLLQHVESKHRGKKYLCHQCDHQATNSSNLKLHVKKVHEGLRYPCNHCEFKAAQSNILKIHVESIHLGIKYPCKFCDFKATRADTLKYHLAKFHED